MALLKQIELKNGITVNYHRIVSINKITNEQTIIEIASYTTKAKREEEQQAQSEELSMDIFIDTTYIGKEYNETDTIEELYNYLKTTDKFTDAEDA